MYDKPGTGLSDPISQLPTLEERNADIEAVLDAVGSTQAVLFGISEGGPTSVVRAATRPERITSLILYGTFATMPQRAPEAYSPEVVRRSEAAVRELQDAFEHWGDGDAMKVFAPSVGERQQRFFAMFARAAASPSMARALIQTALQIDVRDVLSLVQVPALVLHVDGDRAIPVEAAQLMADGIPGARFVRFPGIDHIFWVGDFEPVADEIERFVTGSVHRAAPDRVLTSVLFTDIVASTERAAELGDSAW